MKKFLKPLWLVVFLITSLVSTAQSTDVGIRFTEAIIARYQPTMNAMTHKDWDHSNSIILHGIEKIYLKQPNPAYLEYIRSFVDSFVDDAGNVSGLKTELDGIHPGLLCLFLYEETGEIKYKTAARYMRNYLLGTDASKTVFNKTPEGGYWHKNNDHYNGVMTIDGAYMSNPFLIKYGVLFNDSIALNTATFQTLLVASQCFDISQNLLYHGWDSQKSKSWANPITGTSTEVWSRSIGWFSMALVDMLEYLPPKHKDYEKLLYLYRQLAIGIKNRQMADGLWYQMMTYNNLTHNYPETSGSGMMLYALKKGILNNWLDESYNTVTADAWSGLQRFIVPYEDGLPQIRSFCPGMGIQDNADKYVSIRPVNCPSKEVKQHPHGYCAVLMAASVME